MASRIPIRRPARTAGAENENVNGKPSLGASRAKLPGRAGPLAGSSKASAGSIDVAVAPGKTESEKEAKRKREALRELTAQRNRVGQAKGNERRKILGLPKKSMAVTREPLRAVAVADENARPAVFVPPPAARASDAASHRRSLIPVLQREKEVGADDDEQPTSKRQRTSSVGPDDVEEIAAELTVYSDDEEADPDGDQWEDLDAEDWDDPLMVSEYVVDIQRYLKEAEMSTMPNPSYMASQTKLSWEMRALLNEWLIQVHTRFHLTQETLFLGINLIDRFLSTRMISPSKMQLVGMACMLIASKFEETISPAIANFIQVCEGAYTAADMLQAEQHILRALDWDLSYPSPVNYLRRISKADGYDPQTRTVAKYLAELVAVEYRLVAAPPSLLAAAAMWLARLALGEEVWTPTLAHYAMYAESTLLPVAAYMLRYILQPIRHDSFYKKYAGKRNMKVSVYMRQWALARWAEGMKPDLVADLPGLKAEARAQKRLRAVTKARETTVAEGDVDLDEGEDEDDE
ncbi:g2/mitotic-specific cyclin cdc13 [Mycena crocata]|nr:g2/mitotic-specific cyclin cdc13 [Mycena crocata]